jgi:ABC-2 type transport system permease protein
VRNVLAVFRRELAGYFNSALGPIVVTAFLLAWGGWFFYLYDVFDGQLATMRPLFDAAPLVMAIFCPLLTMRLLAEERAAGTLELLWTLPLREGEIVLGKYLAAVCVVAIATFGTLTYPITLAVWSEPDPGPIIGGYVGLLVLGAAYCALGLVSSVFTNNQIIAALSGLFTTFLFWVADKIAPLAPGALADVLWFVAFDARFGGIQRGVLDTRDLLFFVSVIAICLTVSTSLLRRQRLAP